MQLLGAFWIGAPCPPGRKKIQTGIEMRVQNREALASGPAFGNLRSAKERTVRVQ